MSPAARPLHSLAATRHGFTFYVADPVSSIETRSLPALARCYLAVLPSMSLIPSAPFTISSTEELSEKYRSLAEFIE